MVGYYYLHQNGDLIWKRFRPDASDFVKRIWHLDTTDRMSAWALLIEATALGARHGRIVELSQKWGCNAKDLTEFLARASSPTEEQCDGLKLYMEKVLGIEYDEWMDWLAATPKGTEPDFASMPQSQTTVPEPSQ